MSNQNRDDYRRINQIEPSMYNARRGNGKLCYCCCDGPGIRGEIRRINRARRRLDKAIIEAELFVNQEGEES